MIAKAIVQERKPSVRGMALRRVLRALLAGAMAFAIMAAAQAQERPGETQPPPGLPPTPSVPQKQGQPQTPPQPTPSADDHKYDAYNAEKDIEVGTFYMHKGDIDAAIPRFQDAAKLRPDYGKPRLLLAEAYEKKHDPSSAVKYYKEYLKVYRGAPDAKKVEKRIEKLEAR
jgi:tetratricopeptide (TPR) repeat protein